jgi:hypothetical protein
LPSSRFVFPILRRLALAAFGCLALTAQETATFLINQTGSDLVVYRAGRVRSDGRMQLTLTDADGRALDPDPADVDMNTSGIILVTLPNQHTLQIKHLDPNHALFTVPFQFQAVPGEANPAIRGRVTYLSRLGPQGYLGDLLVDAPAREVQIEQVGYGVLALLPPPEVPSPTDTEGEAEEQPGAARPGKLITPRDTPARIQMVTAGTDLPAKRVHGLRGAAEPEATPGHYPCVLI